MSITSTFMRSVLVASLLATGAFLGGCDGDDGMDGAKGDTGDQGPPGVPGEPGPPGTGVLPISKVVPESCGTCHGGVGGGHQELYDRYVDGSRLAMVIDNVTSTLVAGAPDTWDVQVDITITKDGVPYTDSDKVPSLDEFTFYTVLYNPATRVYDQYTSLVTGGRANVVSVGNGQYQFVKTGVPFAPQASDAHVYGYIAQGPLLEARGPDFSELPGSTHVSLYDDVASAAVGFGAASATAVNAYESAANVEGCEKCHGTPYAKHGFRFAQVEGLPDFAACKSCHADTRNGGHADWQWMVDDPLAWATDDTPPDFATRYAYKASIMNDTHMSHAMEFPYPMSAANCVTCHEGKLASIINDATFTATTCKSCHPIQDQSPDYPTQEGRAPAFEALWADAGVSFHTIDANCSACHSAAGGYIGSAFGEYHAGYDTSIYANETTQYRDIAANQVSIDSVTLDGDVMDIRFSAGNTAIVPTVTISFYGWDSKDFLVSCHSRDANGNRLEKTIGSDNPLFTEEADSVAGNWHVKAYLANYVPAASTGITSIPDLITSGKVKRAEVVVEPQLAVGTQTVALNAPSKTVDMANGSFVANYFQGTNAIVSEAKCNACHDALATTFHTSSAAGEVGAGNRGGNIVVCRTCHVTTSGGSHLEMQSRGIASYIHSIHSFQAFDLQYNPARDSGVNFDDPVEAKRYSLHVTHVFPNFTIRNCEGCHNEGKYNVPDQSKSMPGLLSASSEPNGWYEYDEDFGYITNLPDGERNIGNVPSYVTGPASMACGGCHRANYISEDRAGDLVAFNQHVANGGYLVDPAEQDPDEEVDLLYQAIDKIMSLFE